jgi:hypothetical protein
MDFVCWLGFLHKIVTNFSISFSGMRMLHHNFYIIFLYIPCCLCSTEPSLSYLYGIAVANADVGCPVTWGRKQVQFSNICVLYFFNIPYDGQSLKTQQFWGFSCVIFKKQFNICSNLWIENYVTEETQVRTLKSHISTLTSNILVIRNKYLIQLSGLPYSLFF